MTLVFEISNLIGSVMYASSRLSPSFYRKIGLSLLHLVPEILGSKVGQIFTILYYLTVLNILYQFTHCFSILLTTPFSLILDFLTPHFYKMLDPIGCNFFIMCWTWLPKIGWSTLPKGYETITHHIDFSYFLRSGML